jgi:hypothetical protein
MIRKKNPRSLALATERSSAIVLWLPAVLVTCSLEDK